MRLSAQTIAVCLATLAAAGCVVTEPADGTPGSPAEAVVFRGYTSLPKQKIRLQARNAGGDFETFLRTRASREPLVLDDGSRIYAWEAEGVVPYWQGTGCEQTAEVRALGKLGRKAVPLFTFDEAGADCLQSALQEGTPLAAAVAECGESLGGVIELQAGSATWVGDVLVTTQAGADALACVTRIEGSLTVQPAEDVIQLPALQEVTGDLWIEVQDTVPGMFSIAEVVGMPLLDTIGGTLHFHHLNADYGSDVQIGLPMLTTLPGDLDLVLSSPNGYNEGLQSLLAVGGDVSIEALGDFYPFGLLEALVEVSGDLIVHASSGSSGGIFNQLAHVGGDLELASLGRFAEGVTRVLDGLESVGGDLRVLNCYTEVSRFPLLTDVGGTLQLEGRSRLGPLSAAIVLGGASLTLGAFELRDSPYSNVPLGPAASVDSAGAIAIEDNPHLCQDVVDDFVSAQQVAGWMGALATSGNTAVCGP